MHSGKNNKQLLQLHCNTPHSYDNANAILFRDKMGLPFQRITHKNV